MSRLALLGGEPVRKEPFPPHPIIGEEEKRAVSAVLESGKLSTFIAAPGEHFLGGEKVRAFERRFAEYHGVKHAVAFNSATAALHAAVVATVEPEHEVIVPPTTFTSTATCALMHNAVPVFADVEDETFGMDPRSLEANISPLTQAVIVVHLFGHPARMEAILEVAGKHGLKVVEDCAQAPGAICQGEKVGAMGDCGVFSFTENKNITTGEGGMLITDDDRIAEVARLVRNHGEAVTAGQERTYRSTILGWNYRMTEMEAALGIVQFGRMDELNAGRRRLAEQLSAGLQGMTGLIPPRVRQHCSHVYYSYAIRFSAEQVGIPRDLFVKALNAEGIPFSAGYVRPLYLAPLYQERNAYVYRHYQGKASYEKGICPVAERLHEQDLVLTPVARPPATEADMADVLKAVEKVWEGRDELRRSQGAR